MKDHEYFAARFAGTGWWQTEKEISMKDHNYFAARFARTGWWQIEKFIPNTLIGVAVLAGYLALPFADHSQPAQGASKPAVAAGTGYAVDAAPEQRLVQEIVAMGAIELLGTDSLQFAQIASEPAVSGGPTTGYAGNEAPERWLAEGNPIQANTAWLQAAHAHAASHGEDAPLPSQF